MLHHSGTTAGAVMAAALFLGWCQTAMAESTATPAEFHMQGFSFAKTTDATVDFNPKPGDAVFHVGTGHKEPWPGFTLKAPDGRWDWAKFDHVAIDLVNTGKNRVTVHLRVDNDGADGTKNCNNGSLDLDPGQAGTLAVPFVRTGGGPAGVTLFGLRGVPWSMGGAGTIDPARITQLVIFVARPTEDHQFTVSDVRAGGSFAPAPEAAMDAAHFFPFIDTFGQYIHRDWPGKTHKPEDLAAAREMEAADLKAHAGPVGSRDRFGGWLCEKELPHNPKFFSTAKIDGKWWLIDPDGNAFFSHGIDCVDFIDDTPTDERDAWFRDLPTADPAYKPFFTHARAIMGHYAGRQPQGFNFAGANLMRKYGPDWHTVATDLIHRRLRSWGLNTIGNWSDPAIYLTRKTPYTATVGAGRKPIAGSDGYWGKFPDPFDPDFAKVLHDRMDAEVGKSAGDPWCLGYFCDNELSWGDETSLAVAALRSPADQPAKKVFVEDLKAKYGDVAKLNAAWGTAHASWGAILAGTAAPDIGRAGDDLRAFYTRVAEEYFRLCRQEIKRVAPDQLYLGCRFAFVNDRAIAAAAKYCDAISFNIYNRSVADFRLPAGIDKPVIIGEFHFGALDRGLFHAGLVPTANQAARAEAYKAYVEGALRNPLIVGCHFFKFRDQSCIGRPLDEENYQIGFVDVCDTPYPETIRASRAVGDEMYRLRQAK
jgi:hypothetical protein